MDASICKPCTHTLPGHYRVSVSVFLRASHRVGLGSRVFFALFGHLRVYEQRKGVQCVRPPFLRQCHSM